MKDTIDLITIHETFIAAIDNLNSRGERLLDKTSGIDDHLQQLAASFDAKVESWREDINATIIEFGSRQDSAINGFESLWGSELNLQISELKKNLLSEYEKFKEKQLSRWEIFIDNQKKQFEENSENHRRLQDQFIARANNKISADSEKLLSNTRQSMVEKQAAIFNTLHEQQSNAFRQLELEANRGQEKINDVEAELKDLKAIVEEKTRHADEQLNELSEKSQSIDQNIETVFSDTRTKIDSLVFDLNNKYDNKFTESADIFTENQRAFAAESEKKLELLQAENKKILDELEIENKKKLEVLEAENRKILDVFETENDKLLKVLAAENKKIQNALEIENNKRIREFGNQLNTQVQKAIGPLELKLNDHKKNTNSKIKAASKAQDEIKLNFERKLSENQERSQKMFANLMGEKIQQSYSEIKARYDNIEKIIKKNNRNSVQHFKNLKLSLAEAQQEIKRAKWERLFLGVFLILSLGTCGFLYAQSVLGL